jgi:hypothetical protein
MRRLSTVWKLLNLPCREISELVSLSLDRELPRAERLAVTLHLLYCKACRRFRRQLQTLKTAMAWLASDASRARLTKIPELTPEARERIKRRLREGDAPRSS